ncbi:hypothetical protein WN944_028922 [Citrus x changshan-huyou]|uniref:Uncharacterized protein n=1 Tax=Citrus x changshan-huyou TaxID=2935761 RepID=A0AAP0LKA5_9ROSI
MSSSMEEEPFLFFRGILAFTIDDKELASNLQMHHVYVLATFARKCLSGDECIIEQDSGESRLAVAFKLNCSIF